MALKTITNQTKIHDTQTTYLPHYLTKNSNLQQEFQHPRFFTIQKVIHNQKTTRIQKNIKTSTSYYFFFYN